MVFDIAADTTTRSGDGLAWRRDSVCREHPTQLWFAASSRDIAAAKALCGGCAVQLPCLEFALSRPELLGVWAATTPSERAVLRRPARTAGAGPTSSSAAAAAPRVEVDEVNEVVEPTAPRAEPIEVERAELRAPEGGWAPGEAGPPAPADRDLRERDERASDELLTPAEAARRLGVTPNTVTRWSRAGKISAILTIGGHRRYRATEIDGVLHHFGRLQ